MECVYGQSAEARIDEETREELIRFLKTGKPYSCPCAKKRQKWVAWLEKQGEQETDGWKEGNIIRHGGILALVIKGRRAMKSNGEIFTVQYPDEWVKAVPNEIEHFLNELEKQGEQKPKHFELQAGHWYICHRAFCCRADHLTVNEGERFMCEKDGVVKGFVCKEPEKYFKEVCAPAPIEPKFKVGDVIHPKGSTAEYTIESISGGRYHGKGWGLEIGCGNDYELVEQKPADEEMKTILRTEQEKGMADAIAEVQKSAWSEEDEKMIEAALQFAHEYGRHGLWCWLKFLKERVQPQTKQEWSEEDKGNLLDVKCIIDEVWHNQEVREEIDYSGEELESLWNWLDNIWQRVEYPQNAWKPSDEQIKALEHFVRSVGESGYASPYDNNTKLLYSLLADLKKLREE